MVVTSGKNDSEIDT